MSPLLGTWDMTVILGDREANTVLIVTSDKQKKLQAEWQNPLGEHEITDVKFKDGKLTFNHVSTFGNHEWKPTYEGTLKGHSLAGNFSWQQAQIPANGKRVGEALIGKWDLTMVSDQGTRKQRLTVHPDLSARFGALPIKKIDLEYGVVPTPPVSQCDSPSLCSDQAWTSSSGAGSQKASQTQTSCRLASRDRQKSTGCQGQLGEGLSQSTSWTCCRYRAFDPQDGDWHAHQHLAYERLNGTIRTQQQSVSPETFVGVFPVALALSLQLASHSRFFAWPDASDDLGLGHRGLDSAALCMSPGPRRRSPAARVGRDAQQPRRIGLRCLRT